MRYDLELWDDDEYEGDHQIILAKERVNTATNPELIAWIRDKMGLAGLDGVEIDVSRAWPGAVYNLVQIKMPGWVNPKYYSLYVTTVWDVSYVLMQIGPKTGQELFDPCFFTILQDVDPVESAKKKIRNLLKLPDSVELSSTMREDGLYYSIEVHLIDTTYKFRLAKIAKIKN